MAQPPRRQSTTYTAQQLKWGAIIRELWICRSMFQVSIKLTVAPGGPIGIGNACRTSSMVAPCEWIHLKISEAKTARQVKMNMILMLEVVITMEDPTLSWLLNLPLTLLIEKWETFLPYMKCRWIFLPLVWQALVCQANPEVLVPPYHRLYPVKEQKTLEVANSRFFFLFKYQNHLHLHLGLPYPPGIVNNTCIKKNSRKDILII